MLLIDIAIAIDTASGSPSGIDTIKMTTAIIPILAHLNKVAFDRKVRSSFRKIRPTANTS